jgi:hypothetical protein
MAGSEIEQFAKQIRSVASMAQAIVADGFPMDGASLAQVQLDVEEMLRLVSVLKPQLLYLQEQWFDAASEIADCSEGLEVDGADEIDISPLSILRKRNKIYDGSLCLVCVGFVVNSVLHFTVDEPEWYTEFQTDLEQQVERLKVIQLENLKNSNLNSALEIKRKASVLAKHPAFNFNRPSRDKRTYLAEEIFPECNYAEISQIVDEATHIDWRNQGRLFNSEK